MTTVTVELSPWASQVHCPGERGGAAGIGTGWHDTPTSKPPAPNRTRLRRYRHAQEVTDSMSIETVDTRARAAAAVALVRQRAPETRFLPIAARPVPDHPGYL